jgi:hypothetical protein
VLASPTGEGRVSPLWLAVGAAALVALVALGVTAGRALVTGGLLALLGALAFEEGEVLRLAPLDTVLIAGGLAPWRELAGCALALVLLGIALRRIAQPPGTPGTGQPAIEVAAP